ncbi:MAG TPA: Pls/PosA family non-ribosomal peptide synthetase [Sporichthyaceae bacterium]|nr:Pls/PosA family non-ribosomal peptide synthetase [Sporichthyaceae bacterium]
MTTCVGGRSAAELATELADILADVLGVAVVETGAGFFDELGADSLLMAKFCSRVRKRADLPNVSMKDVYRWTNVAALAAGLAATAPPPTAAAAPAALDSSTALTAALSALIAEVLELDQVAADAHFFDDLGADSLTMAKFCSRVRKRADLPNVSMKDIYRDSSVAALARTLNAGHAPAAPVVAVVAGAPVAPLEPPAPAQVRTPAAPVGRLQHFAIGCAQLLLLLTLPVVLAFVGVLADNWMTDVDGPWDAWFRAMSVGAAGVLASFAIPVMFKWALIGRWKQTEIRVWTWNYLRFWVVKSLVQKNPMIHLVNGSPLMSLYLRALGAKVGRGTTIFMNTVPVCTDLLRIGSDTVIRKDAVISGYHAQAGVIRTGRIVIGDHVVIGAKAVVDIETRIGDEAQLGHASVLMPGQMIPNGENWGGCPAEPMTANFRTDHELGRSGFRRALFSTSQLVNLIVLTIPFGLLVVSGMFVLPDYMPGQSWGDGTMTGLGFYEGALIDSAAVFFGVTAVAFPLMVLSARLLSLYVRPGKVYPLHGARHTALRTLTRITNMKYYSALVADSSLVLHFLRVVGYRLKPYVQTGTNFGTVIHDSPFGISVGKNTVVADGLSITNAEYSASSFRVSPTRIGADNFLGNGIVYPPDSRAGDNVLLGTMVMVPTDGPMREGIGLLGSPAFEIPRSVARDHGLAVVDPAEVKRGLRRKNRHNGISVVWFCVVRWLALFGVFVAAEGAGELYNSIGNWSFAVTDIGYGVFLMLFYMAVERAVTHYATLVPDGVSIYDNKFWRHERYWKIPNRGYVQFLAGTPLKPIFWRMLGMKVGRQVFDDGAAFPEKSFMTIGDFVTLNLASGVQTHSQEDGAFKSARSEVCAGATLGVASFVHYGTRIGAGAVIAAGSFLMKGEQVPDGEHWGGNPAEPLDAAVLPADELFAAPDRAVASIPAQRAGRSRLVLAGYSLALGAAGAWVTLDGALSGGYPVAWTGLGAAAWLTGLLGLAYAVGGEASRPATSHGPSAHQEPSIAPAAARIAEVATVPAKPAAKPAAAIRVAKAKARTKAARGPAIASRVAEAPTPVAAPASIQPQAQAPAPVVAVPSAELPTYDLPTLDPSTITGASDAWARLSAQLDALEDLRARWAAGEGGK